MQNVRRREAHPTTQKCTRYDQNYKYFLTFSVRSGLSPRSHKIYSGAMWKTFVGVMEPERCSKIGLKRQKTRIPARFRFVSQPRGDTGCQQPADRPAARMIRRMTTLLENYHDPTCLSVRFQPKVNPSGRSPEASECRSWVSDICVRYWALVLPPRRISGAGASPGFGRYFVVLSNKNVKNARLTHDRFSGVVLDISGLGYVFLGGC